MPAVNKGNINIVKLPLRIRKRAKEVLGYKNLPGKMGEKRIAFVSERNDAV
jgi:hypothetical protein